MPKDPELRGKYLWDNPTCELIGLLDVAGYDDWTPHECRGVDPHHIIGGYIGRHDAVCNLISVCRSCHDWVQHKNEGLVLCLYAKMKKGELDFGELSIYKGKNVREWVRFMDVMVPPYERMRAQVLSS